MPMQSARNPAGRARTGAWSSVAVVTRPLLLDVPVVLLDVPAGELEEHVVERGLAQREVTHPDATTVERDRHGAEDGRPVECPDRELVAMDVDLVDSRDLAHGVARPFGAVLDPGDDHIRPERALQVRGRALLDQMSLIDDADAVRERVSLLEVLGGEEDRDPFRVEPADLVPHAHAACRVEAGGRLVQEQDLRVVDERGREIEASPHPARVGLDAVPERGPDVDELRELAEPLLRLRLGEAVEAALESEELDAGLGGVERCFLERDADAEPHVDGLEGYVEPRDFGPSRGRKEEGAQHVHERRLAGSVRTQEAVDLACLHVEIHAVDGAGVLEEPPEILRSDRRIRHGAQTYRHHGTSIADLGGTLPLRRSHRANTMRRCTDNALSGFRGWSA